MNKRKLDHRLKRRSTCQAHIQSAADSSVRRMNNGSVAKREPSVTNRKRCATVIKPKITPVVMIYAFIDPPRASFSVVLLKPSSSHYLAPRIRPVGYLTQKEEIQPSK